MVTRNGHTGREMARASKRTIFHATVVNERGEWQTVGSIIAEMQSAGTDQRCIDRWLQGLSRCL